MHTIISKMHFRLLLSSLLVIALWTLPTFALPQSSIFEAPGHPLRKRGSEVQCFVQMDPPSHRLPHIEWGDCRLALAILLEGEKTFSPILFGKNGPFRVPHYITYNTCVIGFDIFRPYETALVSLMYIAEALSILIKTCVEDPAGPGNGGMVNCGDRNQMTVMVKGVMSARDAENSKFKTEPGTMVLKDGSRVSRLWKGVWDGEQPSITNWAGPSTAVPLSGYQIPYRWGGPVR